MRRISKWCLAVSSLLVLFALPASAIDSARICSDAAEVLIDGDVYVRSQGSRSYGLSNPVISWSNDDGYEGTCSIDSEGRIYEVKVTRFPQWGGSGTDQAYSITCSSDKNRRRECSLRSAGEVRLEKQLSKSACIEGRTWGQSGTMIWVNDGCRARFLVYPLPSWTTYSMRCDSIKGRRKNCSVKSGAEVRLLKKESRTGCEQGRSWGHYGDILWVDDGCRAVFEVRPRGSWGSGNEALERQAERACRDRAGSQGFDVVRITSAQVRGRYVEVEMLSQRRGIQVYLSCRYDSTYGSTELSSH